MSIRLALLRRAALITLASAWAAASAAGQLQLDGQVLDLKARERACYLGLIGLYEAEYFRAAGDGQRCVRLSYLRGFSAEELDEATRAVFADRHGTATAQAYHGLLDAVGDAYRAVDAGDRYTYCVVPGQGGVLLRDQDEVMRTDSADFAERFMRIWVDGEDADASPRWAFRRC